MGGDGDDSDDALPLSLMVRRQSAEFDRQSTGGLGACGASLRKDASAVQAMVQRGHPAARLAAARKMDSSGQMRFVSSSVAVAAAAGAIGPVAAAQAIVAARHRDTHLAARSTRRRTFS